MRRARFLADGRVHHGREVDGQLLEDPHRLELRAYVNGALRQRGPLQTWPTPSAS